MLLSGLVKPYGDSRRPENLSKNRYNMIYPYDETRVKILEEDSDYINESYINGHRKSRAYIAVLGPTKKTLGEDFYMFWKMVWQEKVDTIVMLTKLVEVTGMKCDRYWPNKGPAKWYRDFTIKCVSEEKYAEFVIRTLTISKKSEQRQLHHVHFVAWPDKGVPSDVISINNLRHKVMKLRKTLDGPLLVHCSAGIGRTGTYIALDILTEKGADGDTIDVFDCVNNMRQQRVNLVQTLEQYKYLHLSVLWSLTSDIEPIPAERFMHPSWLYTDGYLPQMFQQLHARIFYTMEGEKEAVAKNKAVPFANRSVADIPGCRHTVCLSTGEQNGLGRSTYINAVIVNGYRRQNRFITAQTPLPETVSDFLNMILQENIACIVDLTSGEDPKDIGEYLPVDNQKLQHESFVFTVKDQEDKVAYTKIEISISSHEKVIQTIHHFKFHGWGKMSPLPTSPEQFVELVNDVEKLVTSTAIQSPVVVHCLTGAVKSGLFCAVWVLLEKIRLDYQASVLNTLGQIKARRRMAIPSEEQIAFCFECVSTYLNGLEQHVYFNMVSNN